MAWRSVSRGSVGQPLSSEITSPGCRLCWLDEGEGNMVYAVIQRDTHRLRGVRDPEHAWTLYAREPGDPANWPFLVAQRGSRRESKDYDGDEWLREVGQLHSTCEALEQGLRYAVVCGEGGGKGADQGESVQ